MSSGALTPVKAAEETFHSGLHHLNEPLQLAFLKNVMGGILIGFGGLLSFVVSAGVPGIEADNPGLARLLQGLVFPTVLAIIYFSGAELFTGYPM